ncbi:MAG: SpoVG family protein [Peptococcaceae bacterium]|jgi:DNA-binding cell septation regulator SpoVG|nr:SpoVG family protein [Peptococcaceae bacterium]
MPRGRKPAQAKSGAAKAPDFVAKNEQTGAAEAAAEPARTVPAEIPLTARISTLEIDGDTRAFAVAEYGDLTIRRIRVKEDEYGGLSVAMPKYREAGRFTDTCGFHTTESRNRLGAVVLDAYQQALLQVQSQAARRQTQAEPEMSTPETSGHDTKEPKTRKLGTKAPVLREPEMNALETRATESESTGPDTPEMREPELNAQDPNTRETREPELNAQEADAPEMGAPELDEPQPETPEPRESETDAPEMDAPEQAGGPVMGMGQW